MLRIKIPMQQLKRSDCDILNTLNVIKKEYNWNADKNV